MRIDKQVTNSRFQSHLYESARRSLAVANVLDITDNIHPGHSVIFFIYSYIYSTHSTDMQPFFIFQDTTANTFHSPGFQHAVWYSASM